MRTSPSTIAITRPDSGTSPPQCKATDPQSESSRSQSAGWTGRTGPTSPTGKNRSAQNATKHSLTSSAKGLQRSHPELFHHYASQYARVFAPTTPDQVAQLEILVTSCVRMRLHDHTEDAAIRQARAQLLDSWDHERARIARERLENLDKSPLLAPRILGELLGSYHTAFALNCRFQHHARQLAESRVIQRSAIDELRNISGNSLLRFGEETLPEALRHSFRGTLDPKDGAALEDHLLIPLLDWIHEQRSYLEDQLPQLEAREDELLRDTLHTMEIVHDTPISRLRYRYYQEAERNFFRVLKLLEPCRIPHQATRQPPSLDHLLNSWDESPENAGSPRCFNCEECRDFASFTDQTDTDNARSAPIAPLVDTPPDVTTALDPARDFVSLREQEAPPAVESAGRSVNPGCSASATAPVASSVVESGPQPARTEITAPSLRKAKHEVSRREQRNRKNRRR